MGDGRFAHLEPRGEWSFIVWHQNAAWVAGDDSWSVEDAIAACEAVDPVPLIWAKKEGNETRTLYATESRTIVCIDPIIVIVNPRAMQTWTVSITAPDDASPADLDSLAFALVTSDVYGSGSEIAVARAITTSMVYDRATTISYAPDLTWFSPTLSPEPRPLIVHGQPAHIDLPEGRLIFRERGERLEVGWERRR